MADTDTTNVDQLAELGELIDRFFRAVSFPTGGRPSYEDLHELFVPSGMLIRNSGDAPEIDGLDAFIAPRQRLVDSGELTAFEEVETAEVTEVFGNIAHRLSTYRKRGRSNGADFSGRGVISTQFIKTPHGWRMTSMAWDDERPGLSLPDDGS